jgi:hypothetical protein
LWRFIKYHWREIDAYESWDNLVEVGSNIFRDLGEKKYIIYFAGLLSFRRYRSLITLSQPGDRLLQAFASLALLKKKKIGKLGENCG